MAGQAVRKVRKEISTAAKIRALAAKGRSRADIARALGVRYQQVRNVLVRDEAKARAMTVSDPAAIPGKVSVGTDGCVVIPASVIRALSLKPADSLFVRIQGEEIQLLTKAAVSRRVQRLVREFVPEGTSLVDELLQDRRREVEAETRDA